MGWVGWTVWGAWCRRVALRQLRRKDLKKVGWCPKSGCGCVQEQQVGPEEGRGRVPVALGVMELSGSLTSSSALS